TYGVSPQAQGFTRVWKATDACGNTKYCSQTVTVQAPPPQYSFSTLAGLAGSPGSADGTGSAARFRHPRGLAVDGGGTIYLADTASHVIRECRPAGVVTTGGGLALSVGSADGPRAVARFNNPWGVAADNTGIVYVADTANETIRKGAPCFPPPSGLAL